MSARYILTVAGNSLLLPASTKLDDVARILTILGDAQQVGDHHLYYVDDAHESGTLRFVRRVPQDVKIEVTNREFVTEEAADKLRDENRAAWEAKNKETAK